MRKFTESLEEISLERKDDIIGELNELLSLVILKNQMIKLMTQYLN